MRLRDAKQNYNYLLYFYDVYFFLRDFVGLSGNLKVIMVELESYKDVKKVLTDCILANQVLLRL